jgi:GT2 family glycosyltransferase
LDGDDILDPNFLAETVPHLLANDEIGFVYTNAKCFTGTEVGRDTVTPFSYPWDYGRMLTENLASVTSLFRKADWQQVGGFRERPRHGFEDWDFWLRIMELGKIGHYVPLPLFLCRRHVEPTSRDYSNNQQYVECYRLIIQAHRALYAAHWEEVLDAWAKRWALACDLMAESRDIEQRYWRERPGRLERFGLPVPLARLLRNVRHRLNQ